MDEHAVRRVNMVESQLRANGITDGALLEAMGAVERERFVPKARRGVAYVDEDLTLDRGRILLEPRVFAHLCQLAGIGPEDYVLDVGAGLGYSSAVLGRIASAVVALEEDVRLAEGAREALAAANADNVAVVEGPLAAGCPREAPFSVVIVQGAVSEPPRAWFDSLADGGRLAAVVRSGRGTGRGTLFVRRGARISARSGFDAGTPFIPGCEPEEAFVF